MIYHCPRTTREVFDRVCEDCAKLKAGAFSFPDESIEEFEYHEYQPITGTNLNYGGDIRISVESQDVFTYPRESYLIFHGSPTKADNSANANTDDVALTNNTIMHLLSRIEYHSSNQLIE